MSRKPKRAKRVKKLSLAKRFALSAEKRQLAERLARAEIERDEARSRLYEFLERQAIREEIPFGGAIESSAERSQRVLLRNNEWLQKGGQVDKAYLSPLDTVFGPLALPFWRDAGVALSDSKARELAELFKMDRREIYTIFFSP
ncbi:MAG: hypothetical protein LUO93_09665 [Methanomicrobiales archaeon]|nr:hypothetical protein [Methanomicrobiales archaeon]